ncbi:unnamed protein product [Chilo suppressalis]|uniref:Uncharacterized protein n=1 Tax=Chilo suppressalis TaxID=168631 RepID=A0ABN8AP15_CHISP|nr:unnamed protein product [Chilo suppressalis]
MAKSIITYPGEQKQLCCKNIQRKNVMVALPGCTLDDLAVAALPDSWVPKRAGPTLTNYLKESKINHENVLENITKNALVINHNIDSKIRALSENLLIYIKHNEQDLNCVVENLNRNGDTYQAERNNALKCVSNLYSRHIGELSTFKREALALERQRVDEIRKILQEQFQRLICIGHRPPRDLLHEFDQQVYEINQQLLSNSRAYAELEVQLHAQLHELIIAIKSNINQICLGYTVEGHRHSAYPWQHEEKIPYRRTASASFDSRVGIMKHSIGQIIDDVQEFDECVSLLVQAYRTAVINILNGFTGKLSDLHSHIGTSSFLRMTPQSDVGMDLQTVIDRILLRLPIDLEKRTSGDSVRSDTLEMQKSLWSLGERLRDTYNILHDSAHLWDAHMVRSALAQKLTMACVEDLFTSNDSIELANEVTYNIALEQLRSVSDVDKLQQQYDIVLAMLDRAADLYKQHGDSESKRLECFMDFPEVMTNVLISEYNCFLEKFPRAPVPISDTGLRQTNELFENTHRLDVNSLQTPLPRAILQTELQGLYLLNWRNGFLETFANNVSYLREELIHHVRMWIDEKARTLHMRHSLKLISHSIRKERVKAAYNLRLAELKHHDLRLESHLSAVYELVESLPFIAADYLSLDAQELYPFSVWIDRIRDNIDALMTQGPIDAEVVRLKMCSYALRLTKHRMLFENSLNAAIEICKKQMENRIQEARISNVRFASHLKLHSEGGRYSAQEATKARASLMKSADAIESCLSRAFDSLNHRRSQILILADQKLYPIQKIVDEFVKPVKSSSKGMADKRKPTGKKK